MSKPKKTKVAKRQSALGLYRQVDELLRRKPKPARNIIEPSEMQNVPMSDLTNKVN